MESFGSGEGKKKAESVQEVQKTSPERFKEILISALVGKTDADLTAEEREAERQYREQELSTLLTLLNDDAVLSHATEEQALENILKKGLLSLFRREVYNEFDKESYRRSLYFISPWQHDAESKSEIDSTAFSKRTKPTKKERLVKRNSSKSARI